MTSVRIGGLQIGVILLTLATAAIHAKSKFPASRQRPTVQLFLQASNAGESIRPSQLAVPGVGFVVHLHLSACPLWTLSRNNRGQG